MPIEKLIRGKFRYKGGDTPPFFPFNPEADRIMLAECFGEGGFKLGAEIGVRNGDYSLVLCKSVPDLKLLCVDPWVGSERHYRRAAAVLTPYKAELMRMTSVEAGRVVPPKSLDFVYIDAMHDFDNVMTDIITWYPKVRIGGILSGHDYINNYQYGIVAAVNAYKNAHNIGTLYITNRTERDPWPSWFWVKR